MKGYVLTALNPASTLDRHRLVVNPREEQVGRPQQGVPRKGIQQTYGQIEESLVTIHGGISGCSLQVCSKTDTVCEENSME